ncbi:MAG: DUF6635 family protein [Pseudomonadota bacterium]
MLNQTKDVLESTIQAAVLEGVSAYIENRREAIPAFVDKHYSFKGAWELNRNAVGWDMAKAPANVLWAPVYLVSLLGKKGTEKLGWEKSASLLNKVPAGFRTDVENEVEWIVYSEFLHLPITQKVKTNASSAQENSSEKVSPAHKNRQQPTQAFRQYENNLLMEFILNHPTVSSWIGDKLTVINEIAQLAENQAKMEEKLMHYVDSRKAAAEITAALVAASASFVTQKSIGLGALSIGQTAAAAIAYHSAVSSFAFGSSLGGVYYSVFPATVSTGLLVGVTGGVAAALGVVAALGGIVADPVQRQLGLHHKKLDKLLTSVESQFTDETGQYNLKDQYVARVFDLLDLLSLVAVRT